MLASLLISPAYAYEMEEANAFFEGFLAYQHRIYSSSISKLEVWLKEYPDSSIRDLALYWLAQSYYQAGNQREAARNISLFLREYPENPLIAIVDRDLKDLAHAYENGDKLPAEAFLKKNPANPEKPVRETADDQPL
jgi:hypothetical protein